jgi:hypothetical protein
MGLGRLKALWLLGTAFLFTVVRLVFRRRSGLVAFEKNYGPDRLPPLSREERGQLPGFSRCIACGRCDEGEAERIATSKGQYAGVMQLVVAASRSTVDALAAERGLDHVDDATLREKEARCPTGVPIAALASFIRLKADQVRGA